MRAKFQTKKTEGKRQLGRPRLEGMIILNWILRECYTRMCTGFIWLRIGYIPKPNTFKRLAQ